MRAARLDADRSPSSQLAPHRRGSPTDRRKRHWEWRCPGQPAAARSTADERSAVEGRRSPGGLPRRPTGPRTGLHVGRLHAGMPFVERCAARCSLHVRPSVARCAAASEEREEVRACVPARQRPVDLAALEHLPVGSGGRANQRAIRRVGPAQQARVNSNGAFRILCAKPKGDVTPLPSAFCPPAWTCSAVVAR